MVKSMFIVQRKIIGCIKIWIIKQRMLNPQAGHSRDGCGFGPTMCWVGLNEKYCHFFIAFCVCYSIVSRKLANNSSNANAVHRQTTSYSSHLDLLNYFSPLNFAFLLAELLLQMNILFPLFLRRRCGPEICEIKDIWVLQHRRLHFT